MHKLIRNMYRVIKQLWKACAFLQCNVEHFGSDHTSEPVFAFRVVHETHLLYYLYTKRTYCLTCCTRNAPIALRVAHETHLLRYGLYTKRTCCITCTRNAPVALRVVHEMHLLHYLYTKRTYCLTCCTRNAPVALLVHETHLLRYVLYTKCTYCITHLTLVSLSSCDIFWHVLYASAPYGYAQASTVITVSGLHLRVCQLLDNKIIFYVNIWKHVWAVVASGVAIIKRQPKW
jgi:hypothetical protein